MPRILDKINFKEFLEKNKENEIKLRNYLDEKNKQRIIITGTVEVSLEKKMLFVLYCLDINVSFDRQILSNKNRKNIFIDYGNENDITEIIENYLTANGRYELKMDKKYNKSPYINNNYYILEENTSISSEEIRFILTINNEKLNNLKEDGNIQILISKNDYYNINVDEINEIILNN